MTCANDRLRGSSRSASLVDWLEIVARFANVGIVTSVDDYAAIIAEALQAE